MAIKKRKIKGYKGGGMDASKADFSSPSTNTANKGSDHSHSRFESGSGYYGEPVTNKGGAGTTKTNVPPAGSQNTNTMLQIVTGKQS